MKFLVTTPWDEQLAKFKDLGDDEVIWSNTWMTVGVGGSFYKRVPIHVGTYVDIGIIQKIYVLIKKVWYVVTVLVIIILDYSIIYGGIPTQKSNPLSI